MEYSPDDPFAPAPAPAPGKGRPEPMEPVEEERLAERDPDAAPETSAEYRAAGAVSLDELFRRARAKGFLAGVAAGAVGAAAIAIGLALTSAREVPRATAGFRPQPVEPSPAATPAGAERVAPPTEHGAPAAPRRPRASDGASATERPVPVEDAGEPRVLATAPVPGRSPDEDVEGAAAPPPSAPPAPAPPEPSEAAPPPGGAPGAARPGPPAAEDVARALRARRRALAGCLAAAPAVAPVVRSQAFLLTLVIDPSGRVSDAQVDDPEIEAAPLGTCLVRLARAMSFAPFEGGPHRVELALDYGDPG